MDAEESLRAMRRRLSGVGDILMAWPFRAELTLEYLERGVSALESIARSLERIANPNVRVSYVGAEDGAIHTTEFHPVERIPDADED